MIIDTSFTTLVMILLIGLSIIFLIIYRLTIDYVMDKLDFFNIKAQFYLFFTYICIISPILIGITNLDKQYIKTDKYVPFESVYQHIHVEKDKIVINPLPSNYKYVKYDNIQPNSNETNIFTFEQDSTYNKNYLINYKGEKYILNDHDAQFIKNKQKELTP